MQHIYKTHLIMKPPELQFIHALMDKKVGPSLARYPLLFRVS